MCIELIHFVVQQKQHNVVKQLYFNKKKNNKIDIEPKNPKRCSKRVGRQFFSYSKSLFTKVYIFIIMSVEHSHS